MISDSLGNSDHISSKLTRFLVIATHTVFMFLLNKCPLDNCTSSEPSLAQKYNNLR